MRDSTNHSATPEFCLSGETRENLRAGGNTCQVHLPNSVRVQDFVPDENERRRVVTGREPSAVAHGASTVEVLACAGASGPSIGLTLTWRSLGLCACGRG